MSAIQVDETFPAKHLGLLCEVVELYDESGKLLGVFVPANLQRGKELYAKHAAMIDEAKLARRSAEPGVRPLRDTVERLRAMDAQASANLAAVSQPVPDQCATR